MQDIPDTLLDDEARIADTILRLTAERGPDRSISPTDAARLLALGEEQAGWQRLIRPVRRVALRLAAEGRIDILRKGRRVAPDDVKGVIRLRTAAPQSAPQAADQ